MSRWLIQLKLIFGYLLSIFVLPTTQAANISDLSIFPQKLLYELQIKISQNNIQFPPPSPISTTFFFLLLVKFRNLFTPKTTHLIPKESIKNLGFLPRQQGLGKIRSFQSQRYTYSPCFLNSYCDMLDSFGITKNNLFLVVKIEFNYLLWTQEVIRIENRCFCIKISSHELKVCCSAWLQVYYSVGL